MNKPFQLTNKQTLGWDKLTDHTTNYLLFGGGAGGGKSYLGVGWLTCLCKAYPGIKVFIGRKELKRLMGSTYVTFVKFCNEHGIHDWKLNSKYNFIQFANGSRIDLLDVDYLPSDPLYERFGSIEYTLGWLEEIGEISFDAFDKLKSRINRCKNEEYNLTPKILMTCNPKKHWAYYEFYKPSRDGTLDKNACFIQSLYNDNPYTAKSYGETLATIKDVATRKRLMLGDWDYEDDPATLIDQDKIIDLFTNSPQRTNQKYITGDIARFGKDKTVIFYWEGLHLHIAWKKDKTSTRETRLKHEEIAERKAVPRSNIIVDEDGVGGGVKDEMPGIKGFVNNASPIKTKEEKAKKYQNYKNLKAQCYYKLADYINQGKISINPRSEEHTSELQSHSFISYAVFCLKKKRQKKLF